mgnify:CR=1 FL=1|tara:strand:- start:68 stop:1054 length:987 start_codon:yes stop_codon:yes gene_type:complete
MTSLSDQNAFLRANNWKPDKIEKLKGDASGRKYFRLYQGEKTVILMNAGVEKHKIDSFITMGNYLRSLNLSAPEVFALDQTNGLLLLEDFGNKSLFSLATLRPNSNYTLKTYSKIIDTLCVIQSGPKLKDARVYDELLLIKDATEYFYKWYKTTDHSLKDTEEALKKFSAALIPIMKIAWNMNSTLSLRDFHAGNIMLLPNRKGLLKIGLLDFQDALKAPPAYDVMSLLCDARLDLNAELVNKMKRQYLKSQDSIDPEKFHAAYAALGVQRCFRIIGVFSNLAFENGQPHYIKYLPRLWEQVFKHVQHPQLITMRNWLLECGLQKQLL